MNRPPTKEPKKGLRLKWVQTNTTAIQSLQLDHFTDASHHLLCDYTTQFLQGKETITWERFFRDTKSITIALPAGNETRRAVESGHKLRQQSRSSTRTSHWAKRSRAKRAATAAKFHSQVQPTQVE